MLPIFLTFPPLCSDKDVLAEALLCFGATSVSIDQDDVCQSRDEVDFYLLILQVLFTFNFFSLTLLLWILFLMKNLVWYISNAMLFMIVIDFRSED